VHRHRTYCSSRSWSQRLPRLPQAGLHPLSLAPRPAQAGPRLACAPSHSPPGWPVPPLTRPQAAPRPAPGRPRPACAPSHLPPGWPALPLTCPQAGLRPLSLAPRLAPGRPRLACAPSHLPPGRPRPAPGRPHLGSACRTCSLDLRVAKGLKSKVTSPFWRQRVTYSSSSNKYNNVLYCTVAATTSNTRSTDNERHEATHLLKYLR